MKYESSRGLLLCYAAAALLSLGCASSDDSPSKIGLSQQSLTQSLPARIEAEDFDRFYDTTAGHSGDCGSGPVDAEFTSDVGGGCNIGWTAAGEWLEYDFNTAQAGEIDVTLRLASSQTGKSVRLELDGVDVSGTVSVPGNGWQSFDDRVVPGIDVSAGTHTLRVVFETGSANLNYLDVSAVTTSTFAIPGRFEAEHYQRFSDTTSGNTGGACDRNDDVDMQVTSDVGGGCNVGWTAAQEWLEYDFSAAQAGEVDVTLRVASAQTGKSVRLELDGVDVSGTVSVPENGWQTFEDRIVAGVDVTAGTHTFRVVFETGSVNLNYLDVSAVSNSALAVPGRVEAEDYQRFSDTTSGNTGGACDRNDDVDMEITSDTGGGCNVGWTAAQEWLEYDLNAEAAGAYSLTARLASNESGKLVHFELDGQPYAQLTAPGAGWQNFADRTISNVELSAGSHVLRVVFDSGDTNLNYVDFQRETSTCSTPLELSWPMPGSDTQDWVINNYVDLDSSGGLLDYVGGTKTYNGHRGVDIDVATFRDMDENYPVLAAAPGVVESVVDGNFDRNLACSGAWNAVTLRHANGWQTIYGHLKLNSATVEIGDSVQSGQQLGVVGSSGCSTQAHLHLEIRDCDGNVISPFLRNLWQAPPAYDPPFGHMESVLLAGGFSGNSSVAREQMLDPTPNATSIADGQSLGFGVHMGGGLAGETLELRLLRPDNSVQFLFDFSLSNSAGHRYWYWSTTPNGGAGTWRAEALVNGQVVSSTPFTKN